MAPRTVAVLPDAETAALHARVVTRGTRATVLSLLVPVVLIVGVVVGDVRLGGSNWPVLGIVLTASSPAVGGAWLWRRRRPVRGG
ncbi:hypothetical protein AB0451_30160 [Streptomyces sp. NPDC052000]|uniref:hypothetical protein n=1 Tax=Streptomyces sp. NPDC052000 TaxID=3155676 RepID=UPI00344B184E